MSALLRKFVCFIFGFEALILVPMLPIAVYALQRHGYHNPRLNLTSFLLAAAAFTLLGAVFTVAWWTVKTSKRSARGWGIVASGLNILLSLPLFISGHIKFVGFLWLLPVSAIAGFYLFFREPELTIAPASRVKARPIPGDGTHVLVNPLPWLIGTLGGIAGYIWCIRWCQENGVGRSYGLLRYAQIAIAALLVTLIHEAGHAIAAWGLEMKIRAFVVGPFQLRKNEGKWTFRFDIATTFSANGATGAVHTNPHQPIWCDLFRIGAGPLINLATGTIALCAVFLLEPSSPMQVGGMLFLFGIYSLIACVTNLIPFRSGDQYSDGAKIYQILSGGPFADLHGALSVVASSLETNTRPRDFDVELIQRAAAGAAQGRQLMLLHLFRHQHFFDCGQLPEAAQAMNDAEAVYPPYAAEIPAELYTAFIFGNAYVKRDATSAREWWKRMEAKKPTRFNAEYWLAHSALHWIERNHFVANESWYKGAALAQQLPRVGAYDFDRYKYTLLRKAIDESSSAQSNHAEITETGTGNLAFRTA
jgi:Peptidase family M50